ncbi:energy transducer TonB [Fluviicola chungangensis]|uniref:Energy transducer TonB n=1 Tax=Fluviicola chungangensis TaxID=2597671 RepID=A0A556MJG7_9FLAO|nr:TonB family protein [Fluviicola chungangensis]TSJ39965.1 energy transducer TonB [Fluviicola chungangensis]
METNWNQLMERYLNNELSAEGKMAFEAELKQNAELQKEFELHQLTQELIQRNSLRTLVQKSGKWFHLKKVLVNTGLGLVIAGAIATAVYFAVTWKNEATNNDKPQQIEQSLLEKLEKDLSFENIDPEYFQFTGESDVFLSESGVLLSLTDESFLLDGKAYKGEAIVQWQEAQTAADIVKSGLSTKSGDELLETQGMFSLNAFTPEGKKLQLTDKGVYVQVPVDELKKDMKLFTGVPQKNGNIDWQNPVELERLPKPKDMAKMDLFPPRYEAKLNELKWFKEKAKRDSLYLSFEEEILVADSTTYEIDEIQMYSQPQMESPKRISESPDKGDVASVLMMIPPSTQAGKQMQVETPEDKVKWNFNVQQLGNNEAEVIATATIKRGWEINALNLPKGSFGIPTNLKLKASSNFELLGKPSEPKPIMVYDKQADEDLAYHVGTIQFKQKIRLINKKPFTLNGSYKYQTCKIDSYCLPPFEGTFTVLLDGAVIDLKESTHIPPSKVLAIWNKKFNGTNLATQDFEDRMKEIHETCNEKVFDIYAKNLNTPLWELDQRVEKLGYPQFQRFADQRVGTLKLDDVHQKNLHAFYEKAIETLRETGRKNVEAALKKEQQWDDEVIEERENEVLRQGVRAKLNADAEANFNLAHVSNQLGQTVGFAVTSETVVSRDRAVRGNWSGVPAKQELPIAVNIDRLTKELFSSRKSVDVFTLDKGKKASIRYADFVASVATPESFDQLYFYLLPEQLNSYERLNFVNGKLNYPLNAAIGYSGLAFGMNEKGFYLFEIPELGARDLGSIQLKPVSAQQFEARLKELNKNRGVYSEQATAEIGWLFKEKANYTVQKKRRENVQFRNTVRPTIYSCLSKEKPVENNQSGRESVPIDKKEVFNQNILAAPEVSPSFPGGTVALRKFFNDNIIFPKGMNDKNIDGKVYIRFIVDEKGNVSNVTVKNGIPNCPECDEEAVRLVKQLPPFIPGTMNGKKVSSNYTLPISFQSK